MPESREQTSCGNHPAHLSLHQNFLPLFVPGLDPKCMAISVHRTGPLHDSAQKEVMDKVYVVLVASAGVFHIPEKNGLPVDVPILGGMSPLGEVMRIGEGVEHLGFCFYGSGGTPVVNGFVSPSANSKAAMDSSGAREKATFETAQTVANKINFTMDHLCEAGTPLALCVTGKALPPWFYDDKLKSGDEKWYILSYRLGNLAGRSYMDGLCCNQEFKGYVMTL
jgi:hypothetical protein